MEALSWLEQFWIAFCSVLFYTSGSESSHRTGADHPKENMASALEGKALTSEEKEGAGKAGCKAAACEVGRQDDV